MQLTNTIKLLRKDFEHDQREAELTQAGPDVGAFEGALGGADLDEFGGGEDHGARAVEAKAVAGGCVAGLDVEGGRVSLCDVEWECG